MKKILTLLTAMLLLLMTNIAQGQPPEYYGYPGYERPSAPPPTNFRRGGAIRMEKSQDEQGYQLLIHINGDVDPESVQVTVQGNSLLIERQQSMQQEERNDEGRFYSFSRSSSSFRRRISLPRDADVGGMQRSTEAGVIRITLPYLGKDGM
jgi:HSP20 family molecular chaperone IbpA